MWLFFFVFTARYFNLIICSDSSWFFLLFFFFTIVFVFVHFFYYTITSFLNTKADGGTSLLTFSYGFSEASSSSELLSISSVLRILLAFYNFLTVLLYFYIIADSVLLFLKVAFSSSSSKLMFIVVLCLNIEVYPL